MKIVHVMRRLLSVSFLIVVWPSITEGGFWLFKHPPSLLKSTQEKVALVLEKIKDPSSRSEDIDRLLVQYKLSKETVERQRVSFFPSASPMNQMIAYGRLDLLLTLFDPIKDAPLSRMPLIDAAKNPHILPYGSYRIYEDEESLSDQAYITLDQFHLQESLLNHAIAKTFPGDQPLKEAVAQRDKMGRNALHWLTAYNRLDFLVWLLDKMQVALDPEDFEDLVNARDADDQTPSMYCSSQPPTFLDESTSCQEILQMFGVKTQSEPGAEGKIVDEFSFYIPEIDQNHDTPLIAAAKGPILLAGKMEVEKSEPGQQMLLDLNLNYEEERLLDLAVKKTNSDLSTNIYFAARRTDIDGRTPIHWAAKKKKTRFLAWLLQELKAEVSLGNITYAQFRSLLDQKDKDGKTALMLCRSKIATHLLTSNGATKVLIDHKTRVVPYYYYYSWNSAKAWIGLISERTKELNQNSESVESGIAKDEIEKATPRRPSKDVPTAVSVSPNEWRNPKPVYPYPPPGFRLSQTEFDE